MSHQAKVFSVALLATLVSVGVANAQFVLVPNGDFSTAAGADWTQTASGGSVVSYPAAGGNGGGYGEIDATAGTWGAVIVSEGGIGANPATGNGIPLASLGLTAGQSYDFCWDQIDLLGNGAISGIKLESWAAGAYVSDSGDQLFATLGAWTTESYSYLIDPLADAIKVVMVQNQGFNGIGGAVTGYDNIGVKLIPEPATLTLLALGLLGMVAGRRLTGRRRKS